MAKFILSKVTLDTSAATASDSTPDVGIIENVVVETVSQTIEPNQVVIENGQTINESYNISIEMRTKDQKFRDANGALTANVILSDDNISTDGTLPDAKVYVKFEGATGSFDIDSGAMYLSGYEDFSNGRLETVLTGTLEVISATTGLTSSNV